MIKPGFSVWWRHLWTAPKTNIKNLCMRHKKIVQWHFFWFSLHQNDLTRVWVKIAISRVASSPAASSADSSETGRRFTKSFASAQKFWAWKQSLRSLIVCVDSKLIEVNCENVEKVAVNYMSARNNWSERWKLKIIKFNERLNRLRIVHVSLT